MTSQAQIKSVVCTLDLAASMSADIVGWSAAVARRLGADLSLFHAIPSPADQLHPTTEFEHGGDLQAHQALRLSELHRLMQDADLPWRAELAVGEPAEALQHLCRRRPVDLIVAGSQGIKGFKRLLLGTVVERLAQMVLCPFLFLRPAKLHPIEIAHIGICCDLSAGDKRLIRFGHELARVFNSRTHLLHAMESAVDDTLVDSTQGPYQEVQQVLQQRLEQKLLSEEKSIMNPDAKADARIVTGSLKFGLLEFVADMHIDLLVIGVRRHSVVGKLVIGSSTDAALRRARCHVLTVPLGVPPFPVGSEGI
jgi:nucleotide-binding universal stress UspA family protein